MAKPKKTDCLFCGTPRPGEKLAGYCGGCMDLMGAINRFNVRAMAVQWAAREYTERGVVLPSLRHFKWSVAGKEST